MSRDGNGNYTLPLGAVATGEVIASTWANTSLDDIAAAMTDSLARSGNGGMLAPFRATDGTINAPSLSFNNETNSGVYRSSAGDYRLCVNGKDKARIRDVDGMAAFQVFDLAGTGAWETLATAADVAALSLATVLAVGNTTGGTDLSVSAADDLLLTDTSKIIGSNGLAGSLERSFELYVDAPNNGIVKFEAHGNVLSIVSDTSISLDAFGGWALVKATQVDARLSYGVGAGTNLVKLQTTATGVTITGELKCDNVELASAGKIVGLGDVKITPATGGDVVLTDSLGFARIKSNETSTFLYYGLAAGATAEKLQTIATGIDVTGTVEADGFSGTGTVAITDFVTDVSTNDNDTTVPTTAAVKSYVDASGGNETLAQTLVLGKVTGGTDIEISTGDVLTSVAGSNVNVQAAVGAGVRLTSSGGISRFYATETQAQLFYGATAAAGTKMLETTATGVDITGTVKCDGVELSTGDEVYTTAGSLNLRGASSLFLLSSSGSQRVSCTDTGVSLKYGATAADSDLKLETTDLGVTVTGDITVTDRVNAKEIAAPNAYVNSTASVMLNAQNWNGKQVWNKHNGNSTLTLPSDILAAQGFSTTISVMSSGFTMTLTPDTNDTIRYLDPLTSTWSGTINADLVVGSGGVIELIRTAVSEWTVYGSGVV